jgi:hypothetical protein
MTEVMLIVHTGSFNTRLCRHNSFACRYTNLIIPNTRVEPAYDKRRERRKQEEEGWRRRRDGRAASEEK